MSDSQIHYLITHLALIAAIASDRPGLLIFAGMNFVIAMLLLRHERRM